MGDARAVDPLETGQHGIDDEHHRRQGEGTVGPEEGGEAPAADQLGDDVEALPDPDQVVDRGHVGVRHGGGLPAGECQPFHEVSAAEQTSGDLLQ